LELGCRELSVTQRHRKEESKMKDAVERLNAEYGLNLTDEEMEVIVRQAEAGQKLFKRLYETHVEGIVPAMKIDPAEKS
jgi:uncharacterized protein YpuA (DUF1002 family)